MVNITNLEVSYSGETALNSVSLSISAGDFLVLFGADDAGKTTLLHVLMGFVTKYQGNAEIFSKTAGRLNSEEQNRIRYVPDDIIWEQLTAARYFALWNARSPGYDHEWEQDLCEAFSVSPAASLMGMTYNENKSVQLAAAICAKPDLLILDEPANFLDERNYAFLLKALTQLNELGTTVLLVTEKYRDAMGYGNSYIYLKEGQIKKSGYVPYPDCRRKIVSVTGGNKTFLQEHLGNAIEDAFIKDQYFETGYAKSVYLYNGEMRLLPNILHRCACRDFVVEEMTFEEEIDLDFSRWSYE